MKLISSKAKKLLKDLDNPDLWEDSLFTVRHRKDGFEVWHSAFHKEMIWKKYVNFNLIEKILIAKKVRKLKYLFSKLKEINKIIPEYFK